MRSPCDEAVMRSGAAEAPCSTQARTWILAADRSGFQHGFHRRDSRQCSSSRLSKPAFHATVVDLQWVIESYGVLLAALILVGGSLGDYFRAPTYLRSPVC